MSWSRVQEVRWLSSSLTDMLVDEHPCFERTFPGSATASKGFPAEARDRFSPGTKNTREFGPRVFKLSKLNYGFTALAGVGDGLAAVFWVEPAVLRPGLFSTAIISLVKSTLAGAYITTGTPFRVTPDLSKTKAILLALTFSTTTSVISFTIPSRMRANCSCSCRSRV